MRGTDAVLNATDAFMDGVSFVSGYVNLSVEAGHIDWNAEEGRSNWNRSLGPVVSGVISNYREWGRFKTAAGDDFDRQSSFIIMRPNIDFQMPIYRGRTVKSVYNLTKGEIYLYNEISIGTCIYKKGVPNQTETSPSPAPVAKNTTTPNKSARALGAERKGGPPWGIIGPVYITTTIVALLIIVIGCTVFKYHSKTRFQQNVSSVPMQ